METTECVRVAVNVRPLINSEVLLGCTDCVNFIPGEPQVQIGTHSFTFDYVYGSKASTSSTIYNDCVAPLVDALFHGYNATVLAYGQTGSGKTYTMGTNYTGDESSCGIIPQVMNSIFSKIEEKKEATEFLIRVSFIEIFKEEVFDLLAPSRNPIQIRETANGGITLAGVTEPEVRTEQEMASFLSRGSLARATGSTNMNSQSSRSHAIFTISMEQKRTGDDILSAKLHLVDLAGSERAKRTGADGLRLKEGIHINRGLLALGNVISALGDEKKRKEGGHVPYRDSKLTRLLQDSLGGNSKTVMIACVSPADSNAEETLNTLKYANRARNIQNKAIINRDPMTAQMQMMRSQLEQMQAELLFFRGEGGSTYDELQILRQKISVLEASNAELHRELHERQVAWKHLEQRAVDAQVEKDKLIIQIELSKKGKSWAEIDATDVKKDTDLLSSYVAKNISLEAELMRLQSFNDSTRDLNVCLDLEDDARTGFPSVKEVDSVEAEQVEKEMEHSSLQDQLDKELQELDKRLEEKEAEMKQFGGVHTAVLKQHYEKKIQDLEHEKKSLEKEIDEIRSKHANISESKLKEEYHQKLSLLESQVSVLKKKQDAQFQLLKQKQKSDEAAKRLQDEIHRIKTQKVQLQQKIKQESEQFRLWKASREKEVLQLKKEGRRNEYEMHKLLALNQRQKMVLQRKTEEASMATKRLKELLEARKNSSRGNGNGSVKALINALEHELEVMVRVHEVRSEYEKQKEARVTLANELAMLKEESEILRQKKISDSPQIMSPGARNSRIFALENMLATTSGSLVVMASQLSEAEERERVYAGKGRWAQVRTVADAKEVMSHLFSLASSSRCELRDKEDECRQKDSNLNDLKAKVVKLNTLVRQLEMKNEELIQREKQRLAHPRGSTAIDMDIGEGRIYDLRKGARSSIIFNQGGYNTGLFDDMDTSDSKSDGDSEALDVEWGQSGKVLRKKKGSRKGSSFGGMSNSIDLTAAGGLFPSSTVEGSVAQSICCSCSKSSKCKTTKCQCRDAGGACGASCGCVPSKCENRESKMRVDVHDSAQSDEIEDGETCSVNVEQNKSLAVHGAMLLQSALADKPPINAKKGRKPLSDIGNTVGKTNASKQEQRKKWRKKSIIQLVPTTPASAQQDSIEATTKPENKVEQEIPSKLPRAMRSTILNTDPFKERNSDQAAGSFENREVGVSTSRNPAWQTRNSEEKENHGI